MFAVSCDLLRLLRQEITLSKEYYKFLDKDSHPIDWQQQFHHLQRLTVKGAMLRCLEARVVVTPDSTPTASTTTTRSNSVKVEVSRAYCAVYDGNHSSRRSYVGQSVPNSGSDCKAVIAALLKNHDWLG